MEHCRAPSPVPEPSGHTDASIPPSIPLENQSLFTFERPVFVSHHESNFWPYLCHRLPTFPPSASLLSPCISPSSEASNCRHPQRIPTNTFRVEQPSTAPQSVPSLPLLPVSTFPTLQRNPSALPLIRFRLLIRLVVPSFNVAIVALPPLPSRSIMQNLQFAP